MIERRQVRESIGWSTESNKERSEVFACVCVFVCLCDCVIVDCVIV